METIVLDPEKTRTSSTARILIADDQPDVVEALRLLLKAEGYEAEGVGSPAAALQALEARDFDLLLLDLNYTRDTTSGLEGLDLLSRIKATDSIVPIIVMTAWGSVELAVEAMHRGVGDFVVKPWNNSHLLDILRTQIELGASRRRQLQAEEREREDVEAVHADFCPKKSHRWRALKFLGPGYRHVMWAEITSMSMPSAKRSWPCPLPMSQAKGCPPRS